MSRGEVERGYMNKGKHKSRLYVSLCWNYLGPYLLKLILNKQLCIYLTFPFLYTVNIIKASSMESFWTGDPKKEGCVCIVLERFTQTSSGGQVHVAYH